MKEKEYTYLIIRFECCLVKNLTRKIQFGTKPLLRKRVQRVLRSPWWKLYLISRIRCIPFLYLNFSNVDVGNALVNKSARLSLERICWTSISPFCWRSCVKKNFGEICFVRSSLMYPYFNWAIHAALSSYIVVGIFFFKEKPHISWIWWVIDLNQTHSQLASWMAIISAWFEEVATNVCFIER